MTRGKTYLLWLVLALPAIGTLVHDALSSSRTDYLLWTGLYAAWFLIATMAVTPLRRLLAGPARGRRWLSVTLSTLQRWRRYFGVSAFFYTLLHLAYFMIHTSPMRFLKTFVRLEILTGWIALAVMVPLAWTSTDAAMRRMGPGWKRLQRWVHVAMIGTVLHWWMTAEENPYEVWYYVVPLVLLRLAASRSVMDRLTGSKTVGY